MDIFSIEPSCGSMLEKFVSKYENHIDARRNVNEGNPLHSHRTYIEHLVNPSGMSNVLKHPNSIQNHLPIKH